MPEIKLTTEQQADMDRAIAILQGVANLIWAGIDAGLADPHNYALTFDGVIDTLHGLTQHAPEYQPPTAGKPHLRRVK